MRVPSRRIGFAAAVAGALLNLVVAPFHGAAYFATEDGSEDLLPHQVAWGGAVRGAVPAAFGDDAYAAYLAWGKGTAVAVILLAVAFASLHAAQERALARGHRVLGRVVVGLWAGVGALALAVYATPFTDFLFLFMVPFLLGLVITTPVYFALSARRRTFPTRVAWTMFAGAVAFVPLVILAGHIPFGFWGLSLAWSAAGAGWLRGGGEPGGASAIGTAR